MSSTGTDNRKPATGHLTNRRIASVFTFCLIISLASFTGPAAQAEAASPYGARAVAIAASKRGAPYVYGATGPQEFDCSGLTLYAFKKAGRKLPVRPTNNMNVRVTSHAFSACRAISSSSPRARP